MSYYGQEPQHDYARQAAAMRSYTTPAIIVMVLYFVLWVPGFIANLVYLSNANGDRRISGTEPQGRGCLIALLLVFGGIPLLVGCVLIGLPFLNGLVRGTSGS